MLIQLIWTNVKVTFLKSTHTKNKTKNKKQKPLCIHPEITQLDRYYKVVRCDNSRMQLY